MEPFVNYVYYAFYVYYASCRPGTCLQYVQSSRSQYHHYKMMPWVHHQCALFALLHTNKHYRLKQIDNKVTQWVHWWKLLSISTPWREILMFLLPNINLPKHNFIFIFYITINYMHKNAYNALLKVKPWFKSLAPLFFSHAAALKPFGQCQMSMNL